MAGRRGAGALRHGLSIPLFGDLAEPSAMLEVARLAEDRGWDGIFPWDHVLADEPRPVADVWVVLAAVATVTERVLLGPMVTPLPRRRPQKLAREVVTLDRLSRGRVVLGLGLGVDHARELSAFGEVVDARERGAMLDEGLEVLDGLLGGGEVRHRGPHYTADRVRFLPPAARPGGVPMWMAARTMAEAPLRRAAGRDGLFVIERSPQEVASMLEVVAGVRGGLDGYAVATMAPGADPAPFVSAGVTWWMTLPGGGGGLDDVLAAVEQGPPR
jgi:alkanesulfonate monooxygenase SsuD/methylene tetrahydromethanopterin reductase-like flavin-dependent oxidoreductase (luciferase family)